MNRTLNTVLDVWQEYVEGINGGPSVQVLETQWKGVWRHKNNTESQFLSRRKHIYTYIEKKLAVGVTLDVAVKELEEIRGSRSLDYLQKELKKLG
jgi:hypothetical protein